MADENEEKANKNTKTTTTQENKKQSTKAIIIVLIAIIVLAILGIAGYFGYRYVQNNKTVGTTWGDTYYAYLKEAISEESNKEDYGLQDGMENIELQFVEVGEKNPLMLMTYTKEDEEYVNIYRTNENDNVDKVVYTEPSTVEFLYDIQYDSYAWYIHTETEEQDSYKLLYTVLENPDKNNEADYTIKKGEETTQETLSGEKIILTKFDETFVKPEIDASKKIDFSTDMEEKELKENIEKGVEAYKPQEEIVTEEVKTKTEEKVSEIEETKKSIENAKEEIKKEEERKAAEEAAKGLKVGTHTLKYGKYVSDVAQMDSSMYGTITLEQNGKCHIKANCEGDYPYKELDCDGTYTVKLNQPTGYPDDYADYIVFNPNNGGEFYLEVFKDNAMSDQWHGYSYSGN